MGDGGFEGTKCGLNQLTDEGLSRDKNPVSRLKPRASRTHSLVGFKCLQLNPAQRLS